MFNIENPVQRRATPYKTETDILTDDDTISNKLRDEFYGAGAKPTRGQRVEKTTTSALDQAQIDAAIDVHTTVVEIIETIIEVTEEADCEQDPNNDIRSKLEKLL